ncbi:MAG TPA: hypothetical protein P5096_03495 [Patescibacteria group bacterium]|nr:hypothetical protein [Patescibacteria group bacterium]
MPKTPKKKNQKKGSQKKGRERRSPEAIALRKQSKLAKKLYRTTTGKKPTLDNIIADLNEMKKMNKPFYNGPHSGADF